MLSIARLVIILAIACILAQPSNAKDKAYQAKKSFKHLPKDPEAPRNDRWEVTIGCDEGTYCAYPPRFFTWDTAKKSQAAIWCNWKGTTAKHGYQGSEDTSCFTYESATPN